MYPHHPITQAAIVWCRLEIGASAWVLCSGTSSHFICPLLRLHGHDYNAMIPVAQSLWPGTVVALVPTPMQHTAPQKTDGPVQWGRQPWAGYSTTCPCSLQEKQPSIPSPGRSAREPVELAWTCAFSRKKKLSKPACSRFTPQVNLKISQSNPNLAKLYHSCHRCL